MDRRSRLKLCRASYLPITTSWSCLSLTKSILWGLVGRHSRPNYLRSNRPKAQMRTGPGSPQTLTAPLHQTLRSLICQSWEDRIM